jgi:hypothetical protein
MLKRLLVGLVLGGILGAAIAAVLVQGLGIAFTGSGGAVFAYLAAAVTGSLTGLITGKPIWSATGKIEAGLKAFFGTLLALGAMFALRQWAKVEVDLTALKAGSGELGQLPAASLPIIAALLGGFFELDNTPASESDKEEGGKGKGEASSKKVRVSDDADEEEEEEDESEPAKKRR